MGHMRCCVERHERFFSLPTKRALKAQVEGLEVEMAAQMEGTGTFSQMASPIASPRPSLMADGGPPAPFLGSEASVAKSSLGGAGAFSRSSALQWGGGGSAEHKHQIDRSESAVRELVGKLTEVARARTGSESGPSSAGNGNLPSTTSNLPEIPASTVQPSGDQAPASQGRASALSPKLNTSAATHVRSSSLPSLASAAAPGDGGRLAGVSASSDPSPLSLLNNEDDSLRLDPLRGYDPDMCTLGLAGRVSLPSTSVRAYSPSLAADVGKPPAAGPRQAGEGAGRGSGGTFLSSAAASKQLLARGKKWLLDKRKKKPRDRWADFKIGEGRDIPCTT